ncbi:MAG: long-chain-fatty-acid--CoA ligase [Acidobacteria bacterium]|nr:long-chain-fatty-acid--CoA ligase [Acidobacteriota bacterium]
MRIGESLLRTANAHAEKVALLYRDQKISYGDLLKKTRLYAALFQRQKIKAGDTVAICFENSPEFICSYYALSWLGATIVPVSVVLTPREIEYILRDCQASALITRSEFWPKFGAAASSNLGLHQAILAGNPTSQPASIALVDLAEHRTQLPIESEPLAVPEDSLAVLIYTSGTTGTPKGVMLSHRNLMGNAMAVARATSALEDDTFFLLLPLFHVTSQTVCMLTPVLIGASIAIVSKMDRAEMTHAFREFRPSVFVAVPSIYNMLASAPAPPPDKNPVRIYVSGGAPLPAEVQNRFEAAYRKPIYGGYGLTEASPVVSWNIPGANKSGSVGRPLEGVQIKIADAQMQALPSREVGEICVKGDLVMLGYYNRPEETVQTIVDGWLLTGDMGYLDEDGYLYVVDRKKEMLIYSGINVYPREIEETLHAIPQVVEAAVVGVLDSAHGEIPVAFVTLKNSCDVSEKELKDFCVANLARYKVPRRIFSVQEFPHSGSGKINKLQLREEAKKRMRQTGASQNGK